MPAAWHSPSRAPSRSFLRRWSTGKDQRFEIQLLRSFSYDADPRLEIEMIWITNPAILFLGPNRPRGRSSPSTSAPPSRWRTTSRTSSTRRRDLFAVQWNLVLCRFLKIRNCESWFLLPFSKRRNCESKNDSLFHTLYDYFGQRFRNRFQKKGQNSQGIRIAIPLESDSTQP